MTKNNLGSKGFISMAEYLLNIHDSLLGIPALGKQQKNTRIGVLLSVCVQGYEFKLCLVFVNLT